MEIKIPDPSLVLLIGVAGSGKSTFARKHFAPTEIISSDHCRAMVCDDENNQAVNQDAFELVHLIAAKRLAHRKLTVIDATNVQADSRGFFLELAATQQVPAVAIVLKVEMEMALQQNAQRVYRVVPAEILLQQQQALEETLAALPEERFHAIYVLSTAMEIASSCVLRKTLP